MNNSRFILVCLQFIIIAHFGAWADDSNCFVSDISFDYEMIDLGDNRIDCTGHVQFKIHYTQDVIQIRFYRTRGHLSENDRIFFSGHSWLKIPEDRSPITYKFGPCCWGTFFKVSFEFADESVIMSPLFCSSSYMEPDDLETIKALATNDNISTSEPQIRISGKKLIVDTDNELKLTVSSIDGRKILSGSVSSNTVIPLPYLHNGIIIVRYTTNQTTKTLKLHLK